MQNTFHLPLSTHYPPFFFLYSASEGDLHDYLYLWAPVPFVFQLSPSIYFPNSPCEFDLSLLCPLGRDHCSSQGSLPHFTLLFWILVTLPSPCSFRLAGSNNSTAAGFGFVYWSSWLTSPYPHLCILIPCNDPYLIVLHLPSCDCDWYNNSC